MANGSVANMVYTHPTAKQCNYSVPIINNLTSSSTTSALSANQGAALKRLIDALSDEVDGIVATPKLVNAGVTDNSRYRTIGANYCTYVDLTLSTTATNVNISPTELTIVRGARSTIGVSIHNSSTSTTGDSFDIWLDSSGSTLYIGDGNYITITVAYKMYIQ